MQKKSCRYILSFEHNAQTCHKDKQTDHGMVIYVGLAIGENR